MLDSIAGEVHPKAYYKGGRMDRADLYEKRRRNCTAISHIDMFITLAGRNDKGKYQLLVSDPRMAASIVGQQNDAVTTPDAFDEIAQTLSSFGFDVIRNPLSLVYVDDLEKRKGNGISRAITMHL